MWDNGLMMRNAANTLFTLSVLAMIYGAVHYMVHLPGLFPIRSVRLSETPQRIFAVDLMQVMRSEVRGNFFTVDIERLRQSVEKLPWARSVSIRREFPHSLVMKLEEHQALARWNNDAMVNRYGETFDVESGRVLSDEPDKQPSPNYKRNELKLPDFIGQDGTSAEIAQHYVQFNRQLSAIGLSVSQVALSPRHAWQLRLSNSMVLELGREDMEQRLARFVAAYPYSLATQANSVRYVDMRYRNGFAVGGKVRS